MISALDKFASPFIIFEEVVDFFFYLIRLLIFMKILIDSKSFVKKNYEEDQIFVRY